MAVITGANAKIAIRREPESGTLPTTGWQGIPIIGIPLTEQQNFEDNDLVGQGSEALDADPGVVERNGTMNLPVDVRAIGIWLTMLLGNPTTTQVDDKYQHVWSSGAASLPAFAIERQHPDAKPSPIYALYRQVVADSFTLALAPSGKASFTMPVKFKSVVRGTTSAAGTITPIEVARFTQFQNFLKKDNVDLAKGTAFSFTHALNTEDDRYIGGGGEIGDTTPGIRTGSGSMTLRFNDWSLHALGDQGTFFKVQFGFAQSEAQGGNSLTFLVERVRLSRASDPMDGAGAISATFNLMASKDQTAGRMFGVTLINDVTSYAS